MASVVARGHDDPFYDPDPEPDSTATAKNNDTIKLKFPIYDKLSPFEETPPSIDLNRPANAKKTVEYDPEEQKYYFSEKMGDEFVRNPTYLT